MTHTRSKTQGEVRSQASALTAKVDTSGNAVVTNAAGWRGSIPRRETRECRGCLARGGDGFSGRLDSRRLAASGQAVRGKSARNGFGNDFIWYSLVGRGSITGTIGPNGSLVGWVVGLGSGRDAGKEGGRRFIVGITVGAHRPSSTVHLGAFTLIGGSARALVLACLAIGRTSGSIGRELGVDEAAPLAIGARTRNPEGPTNLGLVL